MGAEQVFIRSCLCSSLKEWLRCSTFHKKHLSFHLRCTPWQSEGHSAWTQKRLGTSMYCEQKNCVGSSSTTWYHLETSSGAYFVHKDSEMCISTFGGFKTPVAFAELDLARQDVLVLSFSCSPSPGIWLPAARPTWQGIYNAYTSWFAHIYDTLQRCNFYVLWNSRHLWLFVQGGIFYLL